MLKRRAYPGHGERGASVVELLVGLAVGLFVVASGLMLFAGFIDNDRRLVVETRLMQDLRATSDLITRDIRRGGYWAAADTGVWTAGPSAPQNNYTRVSSSPCSATTFASAATQPAYSGSSTCYWVAGDGDNTASDGERYGFELDGGVVYAVIAGGARVALSDPKSVEITALRFDWGGGQTISATNFCSKPCASNCPTIYIREVEVTVKGRAPILNPDGSAVERQLRSNVRVRNDYFGGQCPA